MEISQGVIFGLLAMIGFGMNSALSRVPAQKIGALKTMFYRGVGATSLLFILLVFVFPEGVTLRGILVAVAVAIFAYFPMMLFYKGMHYGKVGVITPIANSSALITTLLAVIFLGERLNAWQWTSGLSVVAGVILISLNFRDLKNSQLTKLTSGVPFALAACIGWGVTFFLFKFPVSLVGPIMTSFIVEVVMLLMCAVQMWQAKETFALPGGFGKYIISMAIFSFIATLAYNYGIKSTAVSIVIMLYMANPLVAMIYANLAYKERLSVQQYISVGLIVMGLAGIAVW
ncbi:DMT family transporter [Patescibacteria group bacterium]|nr:MAG: DMT family transporter [Patescibacteria group bacterium]